MEGHHHDCKGEKKKKKVLVSFLMEKGNQTKAPISMNRNNEGKTVKT